LSLLYKISTNAYLLNPITQMLIGINHLLIYFKVIIQRGGSYMSIDGKVLQKNGLEVTAKDYGLAMKV